MSIQQHMDNAHHGGTPERSTAPQHHTATGEQQWCRTRELLWWCSGAPVGHQWGTSGAAVVRTGTEPVWNWRGIVMRQGRTGHKCDSTGEQQWCRTGELLWWCGGAPVGHQWGSNWANRYGTCIELVWNRDENTAELQQNHSNNIVIAQ